MNTLPCLGVKDRFSKIVSTLGEYAERKLEEKDEIVIGNFGSGLGRDTMEIAKNPGYGIGWKLI